MSKLASIQCQGWNRPHIIGFAAGKDACSFLSWIVGLSPTMIPTRCKNCNGKYQVNRWHILRCTSLLAAVFREINMDLYLQYNISVPNPMDFLLNIQSLTSTFDTIETLSKKVGRVLRSAVRDCVPIGVG
jgi:hypothetical protein